jgi:molybdate transport system regulatory protein
MHLVRTADVMDRRGRQTGFDQFDTPAVYDFMICGSRHDHGPAVMVCNPNTHTDDCASAGHQAAHSRQTVTIAYLIRGKDDDMRLSTRNQLAGNVEDVQLGGIMASVKVKLGTGEIITAAITREAAEELGLAAGMDITVLVKATEVMLAVD